MKKQKSMVKSVQIQFRVTTDTARELKRVAKADQRTVADWIRIAVESAIDKRPE